MRFTRSTLTNEEKLVLALHYHVRLSATEIGGLLQRSEVHIHRILHDVRSRLRSGMGESLYGSSGEKVGGRRLAGRELRGAFGG
jgi:DNA-directed RNA polymerase specialized sigma24 family protein